MQDRGLQAAVTEAYRSLLMHGEYPYCLVMLETQPDQVDVNIHPTKSQVKFVEQKEAFRTVHHGLRQALESAPWLEVPATKPTREMTKEIEQPSLSFQQDAFSRRQYQEKSVLQNEQKDEKIYQQKISQEIAEAPSFQDENQTPESLTSTSKKWGYLQVVGQIDLTYIVAQDDQSLWLIDQHAAHERVAFERLMANWKGGQLERQSFLLPLSIDMEESEVEALLGYKSDLEKMGVEIEQAGPATLSLVSAPAIIRETGLVKALEKLAQDILRHGGGFVLETTVADIFATMACHSVIRAGQALSIPEMESLLRDMDEFPLSKFCPHGRSVAIEKPLPS